MGKKESIKTKINSGNKEFKTHGQKAKASIKINRLQPRRNKTKVFKRKTDYTSKPKTLKHSSKIIKSNKPKKALNIKEEEDQIYLIENENKLLQDQGFYSIKKEEELVNQDADEWHDDIDEDKLVNLHDLITNQMNDLESGFDEKTIKGFTDLGDILNKYTSGKLPKLFGVLPTLEDWKDLIGYTKPYSWSPHAMFEGTCIFASNLNNTLVEDFYKLYLVPYIRANIRKFGKLNIYLYNALKKAIYKPAGFFKGVIFPMAENLSTKEANIIGSILQKCSIPIAHSSSAIMRLCELNGLNRISHGHFFFIKLLLSKKYALPTQVKSGIINFLVKISQNKSLSNNGSFPVIYHQLLLTLCQIYKFDLSSVEKEEIRKLCNQFTHKAITEHILKEVDFKK